MTETTQKIPESFLVDHINMAAPQVRKAGLYTGHLGDKISKFDLRFVKPNTECLPTAAMHTLEHLLATYIKSHLEGVIDISPMGCRTGFYLTMWGDVEPDIVKDALIKSLQEVLEVRWEDIPGLSAKECGNYKDHSLFSAKEYAKLILKGFAA